MILIEEITKKGIIAEHVVMIELVKEGYIPCSPVTESVPYDIVAIKGSEQVKVQVKSLTFMEENSRKLTIKRPSSKLGKYQEGDYDVLAIVETDEMKVAYFPFTDAYQMTLYRKRPEKLTGARNRNPIRLFYENNDLSRVVGDMRSEATG